MRLLASLASSNVLEIGHEIDRLDDWPDIHFDIEDGNFTPNITFGMKMLRAVAARVAPRRLDVHMMVTNPMDMLPDLAKANVGSVSAHLEALRFPLAFLNRASQSGMKAGLALNIGTPWEAVLPFVDAMDFLLIMTAEPDGNNEQLNPYAVGKVLEAIKSGLPVYADGALNPDTLVNFAKAGVAGCVLGRLVFGSQNPLETLMSLSSRLKRS